jgi:hypothetical protein
MTHRRLTSLAVLSATLLGMVGCEDGLPQTGTRAIVPSDHLEQQRAKLGEMTAKIKVQAAPRPKNHQENGQPTPKHRTN